MTFSILLAPAGVGLTEIVSDLSSKPEGAGYSGSIEVFHVEGVLLQNVDWDLPKYIFNDYSSMRDVLKAVTRREIMSMWTDALQACLDQIATSGAQHKILAFHPSLYSARRNEQYSTIGWIASGPDLPVVDRVVLLIDDIFDMWERLAVDKAGVLFHDQWLRRRLQAQKLEKILHVVDEAKENVVAAEGHEATFDYLVADSAHAILNRLLGWRHLDMIEAEALASSIHAPLTTLGVKHPRTAFEMIVTAPGAVTTYLSHPISRPRRQRNSGGGWPQVVEDSNDLSSRFAEQQVVLVCPTAIDEFRLVQPHVKESVFDRPLELAERWPRLVPSEAAISAGGPASNQISRIPLQQRPGDQAIGAIARAVESAIYAEVPFRDHYLVTHTDSFFVFRPLYEEGDFSGGVKAEIAHWRDLADIEPDRRALFVHSAEDFALVEARVRDIATPENVRQQMISHLRSRKLQGDQIDVVVKQARYTPDMLDTEIGSPQRIRSLGDDALEAAALSLFFAALTSLQSDWRDDPRIGVLIEAENRPAEYRVRQYANFLGRRGHSLNLSFSNSLESALGVPAAEWARQCLNVPVIDVSTEAAS